MSISRSKSEILDPFQFGAGDSGGGGASDSWGDRSAVSSPKSGGGGSGVGLDLGDDWAILLLVAALVLAIVGASGYLIYAARKSCPKQPGK